MNPNEVVPNIVNRHGRGVVLEFLRERIRQPCESPHVHPHGEVLAFDQAGGNMLRVGVADLGFLLASGADGGAIADFGGYAGTSSVVLHQDRVIDVGSERRVNCSEVEAIAVRGQLDSVRHACGEIVNEHLGSGIVAIADRDGANEFGIRVHRHPGPYIASAGDAVLDRGCEISLLRADEGPDFVALDALTRQVYQRVVEVVRAYVAKINKQFRDCVFRCARHANGSANRATFNQAGYDLCAFGGV